MTSGSHEAGRKNVSAFGKLLREKIEVSLDSLNLILEKHDLGTARSHTAIYGNFINANYLIGTSRGEFILKIQFREGGHSLKADHYVTHMLQERTQLPVCEFCRLDEDKDVIPFHFLLLSKLPGEPGRDVFERTDKSGRLEISRKLGAILGEIHRQDGTGLEHLLNLDLRDWPNLLEGFLGDNEMNRAISTFLPGFGESLRARLHSIGDAEYKSAPVLLWRDAFFYNILVSEHKSGFEVTGVYDFQSAAYGSRELDISDIEHGFQSQSSRPNAKHPEAYRDAQCLMEVHRGYEETSGVELVTNQIQDEIIGMVRSAHLVWYYWDALGVLHPETPNLINGIMDRLDSLAR